MPKIGEITTVQGSDFAKSAKGSYGRAQTKNAPIEYIPPEGYGIIDYRVKFTKTKGDWRNYHVNYEASEIVKERVEKLTTNLKADAEGILLAQYGKGNFDGELEKVFSIIKSFKINPRKLTGNFQVVGHPKGEAWNESEVQGYLEVDIMYIGNNTNDIVESVKQLKDEISITSPHFRSSFDHSSEENKSNDIIFKENGFEVFKTEHGVSVSHENDRSFSVDFEKHEKEYTVGVSRRF